MREPQQLIDAGSEILSNLWQSRRSAPMASNREDFPAIVEKAPHSSSMKGNPIVLTNDELTEILEKAL